MRRLPIYANLETRIVEGAAIRIIADRLNGYGIYIVTEECVEIRDSDLIPAETDTPICGKRVGYLIVGTKITGIAVALLVEAVRLDKAGSSGREAEATYGTATRIRQERIVEACIYRVISIEEAGLDV